MKAVLLSIQPKYCELIAQGKKTVEVRKTKPKLETPFKVYIYCTANKQGTHDLLEIHGTDGKIRKANGKVIGEFVCDRIDEYTNYSLDEQHGHIKRREDLLRSACMTLKDWRDYIGSYRSDGGCAWHISNLIIYDKPKELSEFRKPCIYGEESDVSCFLCEKSGYNHDMHIDCFNTVTRSPQSWCYVED